MVVVGAYLLYRYEFYSKSFSAQVEARMDEYFEKSLEYAKEDYASKMSEAYIDKKVEEMVGAEIQRRADDLLAQGAEVAKVAQGDKTVE